MFLSLVGLVSVCAKFQLSSLLKSGLKVPGGVVGWGGGVVGWLRPILVFSLSLSQAEQLVICNQIFFGFHCYILTLHYYIPKHILISKHLDVI